MSLARLVQSIKCDLKSTLIIINNLIKNDPSRYNFAVVTTNALTIKSNEPWSLKELFDGFLWGAPKKRRSIERRLRRKFGYAGKYNPTSKLLRMKRDLMICDECGSWHEMSNICQLCYDKVKEETRIIQDAIMKKLGLRPVEKEVNYKYANDDVRLADDPYFVEIPKERPVWFASNLTSNSVQHRRVTKQPAENTDLEVKIIDK